MPDDLDPTTARLVSELSAMILPSLVKAVTSAIPSNDFNGAIQLVNSQMLDLRTRLEKSVRSGIDDSRAGRSMIMQSMGTLLEEIATLRRSIDRVPEVLSAKIASTLTETKSEEPAQPVPIPDTVTPELEAISQRLDTLTQGIKAFFETYAQHRENDAQIPEILRPSFDPEMLTGLEGLVRAEGQSHTKELAELSRELSAMTTENNTALVHEVREAVSEELSGMNGSNAGKSGTDGGNVKLLKIVAGLSGACLLMMVISFLVLLMK